MEGKRDTPTVEGTVVEALPNTLWVVELSAGQRVIARVAGDIRTRGMRIVPGDRVTVELSPYDMTRGRIIRRTH